MSFLERLDALSALLAPLSSCPEDHFLTTATEDDDTSEHRIELDRTSDADFPPPSSAAR
ncbi:hypothetical protein OC835_007139 [Tilletia horrida]|uniref:Uncharacterized protein n=1 Tax=Tilletia horrida TaxID=155126 RepID=A0AAN6GCJ4_9BASI|nr:hypothetical protein OC835_007139 [Tilletia horrida]KAK0533333.1 hypothetical protein OC842_003004 [Tilletia horrida]KAK0544514.1 hypothetical protein OC844_007457 [Tilletia horrida]